LIVLDPVVPASARRGERTRERHCCKVRRYAAMSLSLFARNA
jgi:hypothetical protein